MNELYNIFRDVKDGETVTLEKEKKYVIAPEDSFYIKGLFFSNTAKRNENPEGERFCGIYLKNKKNITIDGNGAQILIHGIMTPFIFENCNNIVMKNLSIDHIRPTMSEFTISKSCPGKAEIKINSEFLFRVDGNMIYWHSEPKKDGTFYWEIPYKGRGVLSNAFDPVRGIIGDCISGDDDSWGGFPDISEIEDKGDGVLCLTFRDKKISLNEGTVIQTRCIKRFQTGGASVDSENIRLENLRIKSMNCFGILAQNSGNISYDGLDLTPAEGRTVVSDADFFHFSGCYGHVSVLNCKAHGAHDDVINIHGTHLKIFDVDRKNNCVYLRYSHPETWGFMPYRKGDETEFVNGNTLRPYHKTEVLEVEKLNDTDFRIVTASLPEKIQGDNDVLENITLTASLTVEGNDFGHIPSRAILCTTRKDVIIRNNTFRNTGATVICVADDANFWFESGRSGNIYFENNTVINIGARETDRGCDVIRYEPVVMDKTSSEPVHESLSVKNNRFLSSPCDRYTINLNYLRNADIENNCSDAELVIKKDGKVVSGKG